MNKKTPIKIIAPSRDDFRFHVRQLAAQLPQPVKIKFSFWFGGAATVTDANGEVTKYIFELAR